MTTNTQVPIPGYENCYTVNETGEKQYWYLIDKNGVVTSYKGKAPKEVSYMYFDKAHKIGPVVRLVDKDKKAKNQYVKKLVYLAFGETNVKEVMDNEYRVVNVDGDNNNVNINNLRAFPVGELAKSYLHKTPYRNKYEHAEDLTKDAVIVDGTAALDADQVEHAYFECSGLFHKVTLFTNTKGGESLSGVLGIRIKTKETPEYYLDYLRDKKRKNKTTTNILDPKEKTYQTLPVAVVLLHETFGKPRPGTEFHVTYKDGNPLNLTEENIEWESAKERTKRFISTHPEHLDLLRKLSEERVQGDGQFFLDLEEKYFIEKKMIADIVREMGLDNKAYFRAYHYINKIVAGTQEPRNSKVLEYLEE